MNRAKLMAKIVENGTSVERLSYIMGINKSTFYKKLNKECHADFYRREMIVIRNELNLTNDEMTAIFFPEQVA
jgi:lambda repressor-like predicted transcriptional regulator